jgi:hypothetical protein
VFAVKDNEWLIAQSFEQAHEVVSAINTLSIHAKLLLAGVDDSSRQTEVSKARECVLRFLGRLHAVVAGAENRQDGAVLGTDPRLAQLAQRFLSQRQKWPCPTGLYTASLSQVCSLIQSDSAQDQEEAVNFLRDLRALVEQHAHADVVGILGEV